MSDESFLKRWARLKAEKRQEKPAPEPEPAPPLAAVADAAPPAPDGEGEAEKPPELPPVESLDAESDYSVFMKAEVPEETRLAALRKLWSSDPVLAAQDPLDFQNLDFTFPTVPDVVKTAYVVGKGFLDASEKLAHEAEEAKKAQAADAITVPQPELADEAEPEEEPPAIG
jgi:Protein of unknown function (DUF3306)